MLYGQHSEYLQQEQITVPLPYSRFPLPQIHPAVPRKCLGETLSMYRIWSEALMCISFPKQYSLANLYFPLMLIASGAIWQLFLGLLDMPTYTTRSSGFAIIVKSLNR